MSPGDFESLSLNQTELNRITLSGGRLEQQAEIRIILTMRKRVKEEEMKQLKIEQDQKVKDYMEAKVKGKKTNQDIFWSVKEDFFNFANNQGGYWA
jgi:DNA repair protein RadC